MLPVQQLAGHPLRLASLAASPYAEAKVTEIPRSARNDMGVDSGFRRNDE